MLPLLLTSFTIDLPNWHITEDTLIGLIIGLAVGIIAGRLGRR